MELFPYCDPPLLSPCCQPVVNLNPVVSIPRRYYSALFVTVLALQILQIILYKTVQLMFLNSSTCVILYRASTPKKLRRPSTMGICIKNDGPALAYAGPHPRKNPRRPSRNQISFATAHILTGTATSPLPPR